MVGVPRSRGCLGCRQQKKKCTVISKPPCSRCKRLNIPCVGYGERRLKFQDESQNYVADRTTSSSNLPQSAGNLQSEDDIQWGTLISTHPTNILTSLIASFMYSIDGQGTDTGYHLTWNYGGFLYEVPRCLGSNECLDAAADALVAGYDHFRRRRNTTVSAICLRKYSQAVRSLRKCLSTVEKACQPTTLCAIMILMMIETFLGVSDTSPLTHAGGAAAILKCRGIRPPKDELERQILLTLRGPVVVQAFFLDESYYTATEWSRLISGYSLAGDVLDEGFFGGLAATVRLFQSTRTALSRDSVSQQETTILLSRASYLHQTLTERVSELSERLDRARDLWLMDMHNMEAKFIHGFCARDYGLAISAKIEVNCIIAALQGAWYDSGKRENTKLCQEICNLAEKEVRYHRPLGSSWIFIGLYCAYIGAQNRARVAKLFEDYKHDFPLEATEVQRVKLEWLSTYLSYSDFTV